MKQDLCTSALSLKPETFLIDSVEQMPDLIQAFRQNYYPIFRENGFLRLKVLDSPSSWELDDLKELIFALSMSIGHVIPQSNDGKLIGEIKDKGKDYREFSTRGHETSAELLFHSDRSDLNVLLYVRTAQVGGEISIVSYQEAAETLYQRAPEYFEVLFDSFPFDLRDERIFEELFWSSRPILWKHNGHIRGHYIKRFIVDSQRHLDCPRISELQLSALHEWEAVLAHLRPQGTFAPDPGEILLMNNYKVMHARTQYQDSDDASQARLALRTWVAPFDSEDLPLSLKPMVGSCRAGSIRGGLGPRDIYDAL